MRALAWAHASVVRVLLTLLWLAVPLAWAGTRQLVESTPLTGWAQCLQDQDVAAPTARPLPALDLRMALRILAPVAVLTQLPLMHFPVHALVETLRGLG